MPNLQIINKAIRIYISGNFWQNHSYGAVESSFFAANFCSQLQPIAANFSQPIVMIFPLPIWTIVTLRLRN